MLEQMDARLKRAIAKALNPHHEFKGELRVSFNERVTTASGVGTSYWNVYIGDGSHYKADAGFFADVKVLVEAGVL